MKRVCVYCGSSPGKNPAYAEAAKLCGQILAQRGLELVYGGGNVGLMNLVADGVLANGGRVIGIIPKFMASRELAHHGVTELITVHSMHERKLKMAEMADAFIALPGGIGTLEEIIETFTWLQLDLHSKPVGLLNVAHFYDPLLSFLQHMRDERFLKPEQFDLLLVDDSPARLLDRMAAFKHTAVGKWIDRQKKT